ncbi:unnamed protein product [Allacma fusca]|uniref:Uncharacterized protein n=1 Tax=Allacma fusca TaxID=39272 RepID=A0A8J2KGB9_9HEXA|nr:unnamed protein product [Allacma fusca]
MSMENTEMIIFTPPPAQQPPSTLKIHWKYFTYSICKGGIWDSHNERNPPEEDEVGEHVPCSSDKDPPRSVILSLIKTTLKSASDFRITQKCKVMGFL